MSVTIPSRHRNTSRCECADKTSSRARSRTNTPVWSDRMLAAEAIITVHNPGTGEVLGELPATPPDQLPAVVDRARQGQRAMAALPAHERAALLQRIGAG